MHTAPVAVALAFSVAVAACAPLPELRCTSGEQVAVHDSLYFGTGKPHGVVTPEEWATFLEATVTPRFPQGLTVSPASGQWRGADGSIVRETTYVLHLVHANDATSEGAVAEVMAAYKVQFQQEAVLRVRARACVAL